MNSTKRFTKSLPSEVKRFVEFIVSQQINHRQDEVKKKGCKMAHKERISTHKKTRLGQVVPSKSAPETVKYQKKTTEGHGMYVITYGSGSNKKSMTRHCSEAQAEKIVEELTKQGL